MNFELLPRGNVREFENWLLRQIVDKRRLLDHYEKTERRNSPAAWEVFGELHAAVVILAHYTDRDPNELHRVAGDFAEMKKLIRLSGSYKKKIEDQVDEVLRKKGETHGG